MNRAIRHFRAYVLRGALALIPLAAAGLVLYLVYTYVDRQAARFLKGAFGFAPPGAGLLAVLLLLYVTGLVASNVVGRSAMKAAEALTARVPLIGTAWRVGRQIAHSLSLPEGELFRKVVLVPFVSPGVWTVGFVTGTVRDGTRPGAPRLYKVFVPTPPNPTTGTILLVPEDQAVDPGWTVEQALQVCISGGLIGPDAIRPPSVPAA